MNSWISSNKKPRPNGCVRVEKKMLKFEIESEDLQKVFGIQDRNLRILEDKLNVQLSARGGQVLAAGEMENARKAERLLKAYAKMVEGGHKTQDGDIDTLFQLLQSNPDVDLVKHFTSNGVRLPNGRIIRPKSKNQGIYLDAIRNNDVVIAIGPAGTGKTYLAMVMALERLLHGTVKKIVLCRPALEAGEKLGFLPGDLVEKVNPYLRPLYDALYDLASFEQAQRYIEEQVIEIAPLAFMRGRTLANSFIILDEAQNTTSEQMKMFLTRIGVGSKVIVTGDITQIDLPNDTISGLVEAQDLFASIEEIAFVYFDETDVVRHPLVKKIISAYSRSGSKRKRNGERR
jgi:phosphate starvation-inducible PhoH-like protein